MFYLISFSSYGLLGPSGCGKTTLLSAIVGRSELDSGDIMVKAFKREDIGYMPQVRTQYYSWRTIFFTRAGIYVIYYPTRDKTNMNGSC